jgi:hypothetical protein
MRIPFGKCLGSRTGEGHRVCAPHPPLFQIYGLQIPMNDSLFMSGRQRFGNLSCNALNGHRGVPGSADRFYRQTTRSRVAERLSRCRISPSWRPTSTPGGGTHEVRHRDSFGEEEDFLPVGSHFRHGAYCEIFPSANKALEVKVRLSRRGDGKGKAWDIAKRQAERRINLESKDGVHGPLATAPPDLVSTNITLC